MVGGYLTQPPCSQTCERKTLPQHICPARQGCDEDVPSTALSAGDFQAGEYEYFPGQIRPAWIKNEGSFISLLSLERAPQSWKGSKPPCSLLCPGGGWRAGGERVFEAHN